MTPKRILRRNSKGKFTSAVGDENIAPIQVRDAIEIPKNRILATLKKIITCLLVLLLGIPWSIIVYEPVKNYSVHAVEYIGNLTTGIKENACSCKSPPKDCSVNKL